MADEIIRLDYSAEDIGDNIDEVRTARGTFDTLDDRLDNIEGGGPSPSDPIASNCVSPMTGYSKSSSSTPGNISTDDTLNAAIGKLEKRTELNENNILYNCINGGANLCPINSGTTTGAAFVFDWTNTGIIPAGVYEFSFETSATTGAIACETQDSDGTRTGYRVITLPAKTGDITISDGTAKIRVFANAAMALSKIRLVLSSFKDTPYQPYTMSNAELTVAIQALQAQLNQ